MRMLTAIAKNLSSFSILTAFEAVDVIFWAGSRMPSAGQMAGIPARISFS